MHPDKLKYPIGNWNFPESFDPNEIDPQIETICQFPEQIQILTENLSDEVLLKTYRPGGWNIFQLVHHCADSHLNAFIRFKLTLTEDTPTIKTYKEDKWAELSDADHFEIIPSLQIITGVHARWVRILKKMNEEDFHRTLFHPEMNKAIALFEMLSLYAWHCRHHLKHIQMAKENEDLH